MEYLRDPLFWGAVMFISGILTAAYFTVRNAVRDGTKDAIRELEEEARGQKWKR